MVTKLIFVVCIGASASIALTRRRGMQPTGKRIKAAVQTTFVLLLLLSGMADDASTAMAQSTGSFITTGDMTLPRVFNTATLLRDGTVLIAGGITPGSNPSILTSAEIYDPSSGTFAPTGDMAVAHSNPFLQSATLLLDGTVLITGSVSDRPSNAEVYDPSTGTFSLAGEMITTGGPATLLPDGRVFIAGIPTAEIYDPVTGTFAATSAYAGTTDLPGMRPFSVTLLPDGTVLIVGDAGFATYVERTEVYDPVTDTFSLMGPLPHRMEPNQFLDEFSATLLANGKVLLTGGENEWHYLTYAELYDSSTGTFCITGNMTASRSWHTSTLLPDGTVLITGGFGDGPLGLPQDSSALASAELYDPATGSFSATGTMSAGRFGHTATLLQDGTVLIAGAGSSTSAELYVPSPLRSAPVVTDLRFAATNVIAGRSFSVKVSGSNLTPHTFFDVRFSAPGSKAYAVALNWQKGPTGSHDVPVGTATGKWIITGVRAHEDEADHSGSFAPLLATITVPSR